MRDESKQVLTLKQLTLLIKNFIKTTEKWQI